MRNRWCLIGLLVGTLGLTLGCSATTAPAPLTVAGHWTSLPSPDLISAFDATITDSGTQVSGSGIVLNNMGVQSGTIAIDGTRAGAQVVVTFALSGQPIPFHYVAALAGETLSGVLTRADIPTYHAQLAFVRH